MPDSSGADARRRIVMVACALVALSSAAVIAGRLGARAEALAELEALAGRERELEAAERQAEGAGGTGEAEAAEGGAPALTNAVAEGEAVASYQSARTTGGEAPQDEVAALFGADERDYALSAWYVPLDALAGAAWSLEGGYAFAGDQADVVWTCKGDGTGVLSFATATFDAASRTFSDLRVRMTQEGAGHMGREDSPRAIMELADRLRELMGDQEPPDMEVVEGAASPSEARELLRKVMEERGEL